MLKKFDSNNSGLMREGGGASVEIKQIRNPTKRGALGGSHQLQRFVKLEHVATVHAASYKLYPWKEKVSKNIASKTQSQS